MFTATFLATVTARLTAGTPTWPRLAATLVAATAGALSFGTGLVLVVLLPVMWLVLPGAPPVRRAVQAAVALAAGAALVWIYFIGWYPRPGMPPPVFHPGRTSTYVEYALAYVGGAAGFHPMRRASTWGAFMLAAATLATVVLWWRRPQRRGALVPWVFLVLYGLASGFVTAYGRLDNGMFTAHLPRYVPTAGLFAAGVTGVVALAVAELYARSRLAATVAMVVLAFPLVQATRGFVGASRAGLAEMSEVSRRIDQRATCLRTCATATDGCLGLLCFDVRVARGFCPLMERARIGPFRNTTAGGRVASDARPG
jgi:hypothetical protein